MIKRCGDDQYVFYADIGYALLDHEGRLRLEISPDGVHLSQQGYAELAPALERELERVLPGDHR